MASCFQSIPQSQTIAYFLVYAYVSIYVSWCIFHSCLYVFLSIFKEFLILWNQMKRLWRSWSLCVYLGMCACIHICVCSCICMSVIVFAYACVYTYMHVLCKNVSVCLWTCDSVYVHMHFSVWSIWMYIYVFIHVYACVSRFSRSGLWFFVCLLFCSHVRRM